MSNKPSLQERLRKAGTIKSMPITESPIFSDSDIIPTDLPILNVALSGSLFGGVQPGLLMPAGESGVFKTGIALFMVAAYLKKYEDAVCLFYDSEFGTTLDSLRSYGVNLDQVEHIGIANIEELKSDVINRLNEVTRGDKVIILIDSIGNLASLREIENAVEEKTVADMTRAKSLKSLFRMITPILTSKDIPCIAINHIYMEQGMYPKAIVSGGTGGRYSANAIWVISKSQEKDGDELAGFNFKINIYKSRKVREKSQLTFTVKFKGGIEKWSGLLDMALESGHVIKPSNGWYSRVNKATGEIEEKKWRAKDTFSTEFWQPVIKDPTFNEWIEQRYKLANDSIMSEEELDEEVDAALSNYSEE